MLWSYLTSFDNVGLLIAWMYIIASAIALLHSLFDLMERLNP